MCGYTLIACALATGGYLYRLYQPEEYLIGEVNTAEAMSGLGHKLSCTEWTVMVFAVGESYCAVCCIRVSRA